MIKKLPFFRVKIVKDLFLEKLDYLNQKLDHLTDYIRKLDQVEHLRHQLDLSLENQAFLLQHALDSTKALSKIIEHIPAQQRAIEEIGQQQSQLVREFVQESIDQGVRNSAQTNQILADKIETLRQQNDFLWANTKEQLDQTFTQLRGDNQRIFALTQKNLKVFGEKYFNETVEIQLMVFLYSFLPYQKAVDIGANRGDVAVELLRAGYEVYAFEPFPPIFQEMTERLGQNHRFHSFPLAIGAENSLKKLHVAEDVTEEKVHGHYSLFSSITPHSLPEGLVFSSEIPVEVRTLQSLHESYTIPSDIGLVKIDTEGYDLEVIRGMGDRRYPVVVAEFWDRHLSFGQNGATHHLEDLVDEMRSRNYQWYIVVYRRENNDYTWEVSYYANYCRSVENSLGNVFFFQNYEVFRQALNWCSAFMSATYFYG